MSLRTWSTLPTCISPLKFRAPHNRTDPLPGRFAKRRATTVELSGCSTGCMDHKAEDIHYRALSRKVRPPTSSCMPTQHDLLVPAFRLREERRRTDTRPQDLSMSCVAVTHLLSLPRKPRGVNTPPLNGPFSCRPTLPLQMCWPFPVLLPSRTGLSWACLHVCGNSSRSAMSPP